MVLLQSQAELSREKSPRKPQQKRALQRPYPHPSSTPNPAPHPHPTLQHRDARLIQIQTTNHVEHPLVFTQFFPRRRRRFRREEVRGRAEEQHLVGAVRPSGPFASACRALTRLGVGTRVSVTCGCFQEGGGSRPVGERAGALCQFIRGRAASGQCNSEERRGGASRTVFALLAGCGSQLGCVLEGFRVSGGGRQGVSTTAIGRTPPTPSGNRRASL